MKTVRVPYDPEQAKKIVDLINSGVSQTKISQDFGISQPRVSYLKKRYALSNGGALDPSHVVEIEMSETTNNISLTGFLNVAGQARDDGLIGWRGLVVQTSEGYEAAIAAADGVASAWKKAALELIKRRGR